MASVTLGEKWALRWRCRGDVRNFDKVVVRSTEAGGKRMSLYRIGGKRS